MTDRSTPIADPPRCGISRRELLKRSAVYAIGAAVSNGISIMPAKAQAVPGNGGVLRLAASSGGQSSSLDPTRYLYTSDYTHGFQIFSPLVALNRKSQPVPALAVAWESDASAREWAFKLRDDVKWSDGKNFTSADVVYALRRHLAPGTDSAARPLLDQIADIHADGNHVVRMKLSGANADLPTLFTQPHLLITQEGEERFDRPNGTGPFIMKEYEPGVRFLVERNDEYWGEGPYVDAIDNRIVIDPAARMESMMAGEFDIAADVDRRMLDLLQQSPGYKLVNSKSGQHANLAMMADRRPTDSNEFRLALKNLIPRDKIVKNVFKGFGMVGNDHQVPPTDPFYCHEITQREYDPDRGRFHLQKAGMEGATINLQTSEQVTAGAEAIALLISEAAKPAGLKIKVKVVPPAQYWERTWMQQPLVVSGWNPRPTADLMLTTANKSDAAWNETQWKNERFDKLLVAARGELDDTRRREYYCEMQRMLHEHGGVGMIAYYDFIDVRADRVMGFDPHPAGMARNAFFSSQVWLS